MFIANNKECNMIRTTVNTITYTLPNAEAVLDIIRIDKFENFCSQKILDFDYRHLS